MSASNNHDPQWEDIVRRLGGSSDQARSEPIAESSLTSDTSGPSTASGPRDYTEPDDVTEDFQPPEPKPITTGNPRTLLSWTAVISSVFVWLLTALVGVPLSWWLAIATCLAFLVGAISLFFLIPHTRTYDSPDDDTDYGNGAKL